MDSSAPLDPTRAAPPAADAPPADVVARLQAELPGRVDVSAAALEAARADRSGHRSPAAPRAVVRARTVEDVQAACRIAHGTRTLSLIHI